MMAVRSLELETFRLNVPCYLIGIMQSLAFCEDIVVKLLVRQVQYQSSKNARSVLASGVETGCPSDFGEASRLVNVSVKTCKWLEFLDHLSHGGGPGVAHVRFAARSKYRSQVFVKPWS